MPEFTGSTATADPEPHRNPVFRLIATYPISSFFVLVIGSHLAIVYMQYYEIRNHGLAVLRNYTPAILAIAVTLIAQGRGAALKNFKSLIRWRVHPRWYVFAVFYPGFVGMLALGALWAVGAIDPTDSSQFKFGFEEAHTPYFIYLSGMQAAVEEIAWIGFVLVVLCRRYQLFQAAVITGLMWGCWYIPLVVADIQVAPGLPIGPLVLNFVTIAAICGWLYQRTKSSGVVFVMQFMTNYTSQVIPLLPLRGGIQQYIAFVVMKSLFALVLYLIWGPRKLFGAAKPGTSTLFPGPAGGDQ